MKVDTHFQFDDPRFKKLILANTTLQRISTGHLWTEGPVWFGDHNFLLFSDIPNQRILRWTPCGSVTVFRENSNFANGHCRDKQGRLISCEHGTRSVTRTELDGQVTRLASEYLGKPLNSPNDVVVKSDGSIWFTDPTYGISSNYEGYKADAEQDGQYVFRLDPVTRDLEVVAQNFYQPNGLAFSCDEQQLFIVDSGRSENDEYPTVIKVLDVTADNHLINERDFAFTDPGIPDGMCVDNFSNIWVSAQDGVHCFAPCGTLLGKIFVPEIVSNVAFGGLRGNQLFITASSSVYSLYINASSALAMSSHEK